MAVNRTAEIAGLEVEETKRRALSTESYKCRGGWEEDGEY